MKSKKTVRTLLLCIAAFAIPAATWAQTTVPATGGFALRRGGEREFTLGGSGASNTDFDSSFGGVSVSLGYYTNENNAWFVRQTMNYSNPDRGGTEWFGSTRVAYDYHFPVAGAVRPFVGANFGGVYGDGVQDTWAAGLETGIKFYVQPRTFVYAMAEYGWFFDRASGIDNRFSDGAFTWSVGLGFNF